MPRRRTTAFSRRSGCRSCRATPSSPARRSSSRRSRASSRSRRRSCWAATPIRARGTTRRARSPTSASTSASSTTSSSTSTRAPAAARTSRTSSRSSSATANAARSTSCTSAAGCRATSGSSRSSCSGCRTATRSTPTRRGRSGSAPAGCSPRSRRPASAATASSSAPTSRGRTSTPSTGRSTGSARSPRSSRSGCSGATTRSCTPVVADRALLDVDDRRLLVELQSLGVRVEDETGGGVPGRRGGGGPADAGFIWVRGLPLTVPMHAAFARDSPYTLRLTDQGPLLLHGDDDVGPVRIPRRPRIYDMTTADGVPYWKIALLHLDSIASTVVQKCIYWGTHEQCGFCGIELTRGEQTIPVKTPAQLAEVCTAARDLDGAVDVTLTTGSINRRDRGALYISRCAAAIKDACGLPVQVQFEPPDDLAVLEQVRSAGVDSVGIHIESFDPDVLARVAAGKAQCGVEGYFRCWERAVEVFGRGRVSTYVILGMGERRGVTEEGCRRAIELGVYPFV